ncbi:MAG: aspartate/glutamate racemase family protein [Candidatus Aerophobetes bacterium]|nr:aspartate/glutamate racemase family protein [Candidatus Aerophobetes bacterium]
MRVLVINPVTTKEWLKEDREYLQGIADETTEVEIVGIEKGPKSIETFHDAVYAGPEILRLVKEKVSSVEAIMINCFADPAVDASREITDKVVLGPAETSMSVALHLGFRFSVISTFANTAPWVRLQARKFGVESRLASAIGVDIPVLELEKDSQKTVDEILRGAEKAIELDGAEVIILGCTGMAGLARKVRERLDVPLIEPAGTTLKMAELLVKLGLRHNRGRLYLTPSFDKIEGYG